MNICFIANINSPHTRRWIGPLISNGHGVSVFSYTAVKHSIEKAEVIDLTAINNTPKLRFLVWAREIRKRVNREKPDIVHAHQIQAAGWLGTLTRYHPFVVTAWGSDILVSPFRSRIGRLLTGRVLSFCDALTVPSATMYDKALTLGIGVDKLFLIPWGFDSSPFRPRGEDRSAIRTSYGIDRDAKVILSPRGIRPIYNHDIVLEAVRFLLPHEPRLNLVLIKQDNTAGYRRELEALISSLGIEHVVKWIPYQQSMEDLGRVYRMSDVLVSIPSSEGYGFTAYESLAAGCLTIVSDLPVFDSNLQDGVQVLKVPVRDVRATAEALKRLLSNDEMRGRNLDGAPYANSVETVQEQFEQTMQLYSTLIGRQ